jgi:hypothetical protein
VFRRKSQELVIVWNGDGLMVEGDPGLVELVAAQLMEPGGRVRRSRQPVADLFAAGTAAYALAATHREYFQFSAQALQRLAEHGAIPSPDATGFFRSFVRDGKGFAGNLDWAPVSFSPEQALSLEVAAATMALRAAIADVKKAVERVEGKVDQVVRLVRAERLGHVLGDRQVLSSLVGRLDAGGPLSDTDWQSVAHLGADMVRDLEAARSYLRLALEDDPTGMPRHRVGVATDLLDDTLVRETLALLVVSESNLGMWQRLRIAQVAKSEPEHLAGAVEHAREFLASQRDADQALADKLAGFTELVASPIGLEGLTVIQTVKLKRVVRELSDLTAEFVDQRCLDLAATAEVDYPGARESAAYVARRTRDAGADVVRTAGVIVDSLRPRSDDGSDEQDGALPPISREDDPAPD